MRAFGTDGGAAHSAPVYLADERAGEHRQREAVPSLAAKYRGRIENLPASDVAPHEDLESWSTGAALPDTWRAPRPLLRAYAARALERYDALAARARIAPPIRRP